MADDCSSAAEDATAAAVAELDSNSRVTRVRHKCADATATIAASELFLSSNQDASFVKCIERQDAFTACSYKTTDDHHYRLHRDRCVHHCHRQHPFLRHYRRNHRQLNYHHHHHHHHYYHHHHHHFNPHRRNFISHRDNDSDRVSNDCDNGDIAMTSDDSQSCVDATVLVTVSDDEEVNGSGAVGIGVVAPCGGVGSGSGGSCSGSIGLYHLGIEIVRSVVKTTQRNEDGIDSDGDGDSGGSSSSNSSIISNSKSDAVAVIMTGGNNNTAETAGVDVDVEDVDAADDSSSSRRSTPSVDDIVPEVNDRGTDHDDRRRGATSVVVETESTTIEETRSDAEDVVATAKTLSNNGIVVARYQSNPSKGQVRMAEDTLVGPCGKKRCADRYDSSESSDSGVAVSCGECSSSGTSDITEPGSPYSTSSDEGVAVIRGTCASPLPSPLKLAPSSQTDTRPSWPWAPLLATACSTTAYKRLRGEPEAGALPRSGAADPTSRSSVKTGGKNASGQHHHESQGKITEYYNKQIKPQQPKVKKTNETMSVLVKSSSEFRRPPIVQRNKGGLAKYLGTMSSNQKSSANDREVKTLTSPSATAKKLPVIVPRINSKMDKKLAKPLPSLPISNEKLLLKNLPTCKISSSLRLPSDSNVNNAKCSSSTTTATSPLLGEPLDFKSCILSHVNENNNFTNGCGNILGVLRSQTGHDTAISRLSSPLPSKEDEDKGEEVQTTPIDEDDVDVDEEDSRSSESKQSLSPILSTPTTIRFPAREPEKDRSQATDSGICRWDKCEASFEAAGGLLEHLQSAHINTQTGSDNFVCHWQGCKVQGRTSCSRRWLERHVMSHGGNKPFRCIVEGCGCRFSSQTALERHVNNHFNQPETTNNNGRRSCENGGKLVRKNSKKLRYRRQPRSAKRFDYFDASIMEGLQHRLQGLAASRTQGRLQETPGNSMVLTSKIVGKRVELDGRTKVLLRWHPLDIEPDEWVLESEVQITKYIDIRKAVAINPEEVILALYPAISGRTPPTTHVKQRRKPVKNS